MNEIKLERQNRIANVSGGMIHGIRENCYQVFGRFLQISITKISLYTLVSQRNIYLNDHCMNDNLS